MALSPPAKRSFLIWICLLLCLLPFVILSFLNFIAYDDYEAVDNFSRHGFFGAQQLVYANWEGRFTATFLCGIFVKLGILTHYYFLVFLLFALFTWGAIFFFIQSVNARCLHGAFSRRAVVQASLILFVLDIYVMVEMSSGIYWFSPAAVYQTGFILFLLLSGCLVRRLSVGPGSGGTLPGRWSAGDAVIILLCILVGGCNEVTSIALACFFLFLIGIYRRYGIPVPFSLFLYLGTILLTGAIIMLTSGILTQRLVFIHGHAGYGGILAILLFRAASIFYYVLKEPLFWACAGACFVLGMQVAAMPALSTFVSALRSRRFFIPGIAMVVLLVLLAIAPILIVTHGSIPERALNDMTSLAAFGLLAMIFLLGLRDPFLARIVLPMKNLSTLIVVGIVCGLLASYNYKEAWKNVITGYFYHAIQIDRRKILETAHSRHERVAVVTPYAMALEEKLREIFPHGAPATLKYWLEDRPTLISFDNEAEDPRNFLLPHYQLDSILVRPRP
ncbi:MAG TPA: DUF6056 family protein [Puia sp.]|nr:DUF6056 family protein [Puia sp.]